MQRLSHLGTGLPSSRAAFPTSLTLLTLAGMGEEQGAEPDFPQEPHPRIPAGSGSSCPIREGIGAFPIATCSQLLCIPDSGGKGEKAMSSHLINAPLFAHSSILAPSIVPAHNYSNLCQGLYST